MKSSTLFTLASGLALVAADCAGPGDYDAQGRYSCNPAHQYPNGQSCKDIDGCPLLVDSNGQPIIEDSATTSPPQPSPTDKCAGPGEYDAQGRYSCNPAHQYPNGQSCKDIDGCPLLVDSNGQPIKGSATASSAQPTATDDCAGPGEYDAQGRYSCNPAHQYPNGQSCKTIDGCPLLCDSNGQPIIKNGTTPTHAPTAIPTAGAAALQGGMALLGAMALVLMV